jgi:hypothetical protein
MAKREIAPPGRGLGISCADGPLARTACARSTEAGDYV